jgi:cytosine/uracil/thiamine/allantoin permease
VTDIIGATIITLAMVANGCQGGKVRLVLPICPSIIVAEQVSSRHQWHIPFAVGNRAGWGVNGAQFVVLNRLILSFCWYVHERLFAIPTSMLTANLTGSVRSAGTASRPGSEDKS